MIDTYFTFFGVCISSVLDESTDKCTKHQVTYILTFVGR